MNTEDQGTPRTRARVDVGRDQNGQIAIGDHISQQQFSGEPPTQEELLELHERFAELERRIAAEVPAELQADARSRVADLEEAVVAEEPDLTTMEYVRDWFARRLPSIAGAVTGVIVNPIVGKLVGAAGDAVVAEFRRRFGDLPAGG